MKPKHLTAELRVRLWIIFTRQTSDCVEFMLSTLTVHTLVPSGFSPQAFFRVSSHSRTEALVCDTGNTSDGHVPPLGSGHTCRNAGEWPSSAERIVVLNVGGAHAGISVLVCCVVVVMQQLLCGAVYSIFKGIRCNISWTGNQTSPVYSST